MDGDGSDAPPAEAVTLTEGEGACRRFLSAFLDVLYTARQRRASSVSLADITADALSSSLPSSSASSLSRRHLRSIDPNLPAIDEVLDSASGAVVLLSRHFPRSLAAFLRTGAIGSESEESRLFLLYQSLHCLSFLHERRVVHGDIKTRNLMVTGNLWLYLVGLHCPAALPAPLTDPAITEDSALMRWSQQQADRPLAQRGRDCIRLLLTLRSAALCLQGAR